MRGLSFFIVYIFLSFSVFAQKKNSDYKLQIHKASSPIIIDGEMDEAAWLEAMVATNFHMILPMDTSKAEVRTDVRMAYDDQN
ncbi:MAG: hydrolase, partial [Bacteroidota bacterium]|nr:hydrolase [Bacteroidota bacterium]